MMISDRYLNLSDKLERKEALKLCVDFYQFFYYPDINIDILKNITWDDISDLYQSNSPISQKLSDFPKIIDILKYIRLSHISYLQMIDEDKDSHFLEKHISFQEYDDWSENAREYLKNEFEHMPILDLYSDSIFKSDSICYPLQYMNVFFYRDNFRFLLGEKKTEIYGSTPDSRKKLFSTLEKYGLSEFKNNVLERNIPGSQTKYSIPRCSIISLTFALLAINSKDIPIEFQYYILSDFVINICIANSCKPYQILTYITKLKKGFSPKKVILSRYSFFCSFQQKIRQSVDAIIDSNFETPAKRRKRKEQRKEKSVPNTNALDNINLFWNFSTEFLGLVEKYASLQQKMNIFREVEKNFLSGKPSVSNIQNNSSKIDTSSIENLISAISEKFHYKERNYEAISYDELYDSLSNNDGTINNLIFFNEIQFLYQIFNDNKKNFKNKENSDTDDRKNLVSTELLYSKLFFNHFK